jgi:transcriptional regulator GlxA family with amidase domain
MEPLRLANELADARLFTWQATSEAGGAVPAQCATQIATVSFAAAPARPDYVIVFGHWERAAPARDALARRLRQVERAGGCIGAVGAAIPMLLAMGYFDRHNCAAHWRQLSLINELYPDIALSESTTEIDGRRLTCAGGTAAVDAGLALVEREASRAFRDRCAALMVHERSEATPSQRRFLVNFQLANRHPKLGRATDLMLTYLEQPLSSDALAKEVGTSTRNLQRIFRRQTGSTVSHFYLRLRLQWARELLRSSGYSIAQIALASGFVSASHFTKMYKRAYGRKPSEERAIDA